MRTVSDTITRLGAIRGLAMPGQTAAVDRLVDMDAFGSNPGDLRARLYVPARLGADPALVVVLHGCTQTAAGYDTGSGWSELADELGFVVLFPEQRRANNPNLCFNWFAPDDTRRGSGEALSIRQMTAAAVRMHGIDERRIYVTGLSAGGAMTATMLATYPDVFASGAVIAGLPFGCAKTVPEAFDRMRGHGGPGPDEASRAVREASDFDGEWPTLSVWHGDADATVAVVNSDAIVAQWRSLHGLSSAPSATETIDGHLRRVWHDDRRGPVIEEYRIGGMGHGTPVDGLADPPCGRAGPYMLEAGISSTRRIAAFWGLDREGERDRFSRDRSVAPPVEAPEPATLPKLVRPDHTRDGKDVRPGPSSNLQTVIEGALRTAGLLR